MKRRGFTLTEMLVVLGLLVGVTALAQPLLRGSLGDNRLRAAAKLVRLELAKARVKAMQTGVAQQFRHELGKNRFETAPARPNEERAAPIAATDRARQRVAQADEPAAPGEEIVEQALPEGVAFDDTRDEPGAGDTGDGWSEPIVFYPNGRTDSAHMRLKGERNGHIEVSLRGLTGVATAGKLRHDEELR